jgi:hypothetical protein
VTVNVTQQGAVHTLDGDDNRCGAPQRAPLVGHTIAIGADGLSLISYQDITANALRVIKCGTRTCQ